MSAKSTPESTAWELLHAANKQQQEHHFEQALALAGTAPTRAAPASTSHAPGSPVLWYVGLLLALSGLWWFERNRDLGGLVASLRARLRR